MNVQKLKVLVVDDDAEIRRFLTELLESEGHTVVTATNGLDGVLKATRDFDIAILDMMMPIFDGINVCKSLKDDPETANIAVLFLTGYEDPDVLKSCSESGDALLHKPVKCEDLLSKIAELTESRLVLA